MSASSDPTLMNDLNNGGGSPLSTAEESGGKAGSQEQRWPFPPRPGRRAGPAASRGLDSVREAARKSRICAHRADAPHHA